MKKVQAKTYLALHLLLFIMALSGVCSKLAGAQPVFSFRFFLFYGLMLAILVVYAAGWQQIIKRMPLSVAFANKGATMIWSLVFGASIFHEEITWNRVVGCLFTIAGVLLYVWADKEAAIDD